MPLFAGVGNIHLAGERLIRLSASIADDVWACIRMCGEVQASLVVPEWLVGGRRVGRETSSSVVQVLDAGVEPAQDGMPVSSMSRLSMGDLSGVEPARAEEGCATDRLRGGGCATDVADDARGGVAALRQQLDAALRELGEAKAREVELMDEVDRFAEAEKRLSVLAMEREEELELALGEKLQLGARLARAEGRIEELKDINCSLIQALPAKAAMLAVGCAGPGVA